MSFPRRIEWITLRWWERKRCLAFKIWFYLWITIMYSMKFADSLIITSCDCPLMLNPYRCPSVPHHLPNALCSLRQHISLTWQWGQPMVSVLLPPTPVFGCFARTAAAHQFSGWWVLGLTICKLCSIAQHQINLDELPCGLLQDPWLPLRVWFMQKCSPAASLKYSGNKFSVLCACWRAVLAQEAGEGVKGISWTPSFDFLE